MKKPNTVLGLDPGYVSDPTGVVLVRVCLPQFVLHGNTPVNPESGEPIKLPEGTTLAEFAQPSYEIIDSRRERGLTFDRITREAVSISNDLNGDLHVGVDQTGLGRGLVENLRRAGLHTTGCNLTAGSKITGSGWSINLPTSILVSTIYKLLGTGKLRITSPNGEALKDELQNMEREVTDAGHERYEIGSGTDGHGDIVFALGITLVIAERIHGRQQRALMISEARAGERERPQGRERRQGEPRAGGGGNTARKYLDSLKEQWNNQAIIDRLINDWNGRRN